MVIISRSLFVSLALIPFSLSQSTSSTDLGTQIAAIEAHFRNAGIVPSLLATFAPSALLDITFGGVGTVSPGIPLTRARQSR